MSIDSTQKAPDFHYSINHLEEERLLLQSRACRLEKSFRGQFENKCGEQYKLAKRLRDQAGEIERAQQILNDQERIFSDPKIAESISSFTESQKVKEENSKTEYENTMYTDSVTIPKQENSKT